MTTARQTLKPEINRSEIANEPTLTEMFNFYSSGDEVLELGPQGITVLDWDASVRQYTWHKQEAFKGRNILYGSGWAGWGFESNVTAQAVNAASPETLRDFPIFEHDPDEMFCATIATNMQNRILAKGIPALSETIGMSTWAPAVGEGIRTYNMNDLTSRRWPRPPVDNSHKWLHSDIQNLSLFFTYGVFSEVVDKGDLDE